MIPVMADDCSDIRPHNKCDLCSRCFVRAEHLNRHRRTHTKEKPFACPYCHRSFQRSDVKAVHVKKCHSASSNPSTNDAETEPLERKRVRIACDSCRRRKVRCDGNDPCATCQSIGASCHYTISSASSNLLEPSLQVELANAGYPDTSLDSFGASMDDTGSASSFSFTMQTTDFDREPSQSIGIDSLQGTDHELPLSFQVDAASAQVTNSVAYEDHNLALSQEDVMYPILDAGNMNDFLQMQAMNSQFWFEESDLAQSDWFFEPVSPNLDHIFSSSIPTLTATMQEYFDQKSGAPSPSLNKASKMWYSAPPNLKGHNRDIVKVFVNIFRRHIPETFSLFKGSNVSQKGKAAFTLAMAAIGGSFCTVPGSAEVAKSMYNDARRLLLATFNTRNAVAELSSDPEEQLSVVKTFILLELYGLCSGDRRSYEFVEVFHANLIQSVQEYSQSCKGADRDIAKESEQLQLLETLFVLDCYRVIIMQRPPSLSWHHVDSFSQLQPSESEIGRLFHTVEELTDGGHASALQFDEKFSLATLACLCIYSWPASYPRQNSYGANNMLKESLSLWKADFAELACDTWLRTSGKAKTPSQLAIYHMMNIMLHTNLTVLQNFAHSAPGSSARDPKQSLAAREIYAWAQDRHFKIARWHAENMIISIEGAFTALTSRVEHQDSSQSSFSSTERPRLLYEAPHVPYAIYYATLVLWCGAFINTTTVTSLTAAQAPLATGERILSLHKVHIAQLLARVLNEIK